MGKLSFVILAYLQMCINTITSTGNEHFFEKNAFCHRQENEGPKRSYYSNDRSFTPHSVTNFTNFQPLNSGYFGKVLSANHKHSGEAFAIKITDVNLLREVKILMRLSHTHVVKYENFWEEELEDLKDAFGGISNLHIIQMELCQGEDLEKWIKNVPFWMKSEQEAQKIILQLLLAVEYIHAQGIVHRDLKPRNILLKYPYKMKQRELVVKVVDFGASVDLFEISQPTNAAAALPGGTPFYTSPEQEAMKSHDTSTDIFSVGLIMYEILMSSITDCLEETRDEDIRNRKGIFPKLFVDTFKEENQLIQRALSEEPSERPTATYLIQTLKTLWPERKIDRIFRRNSCN